MFLGKLSVSETSFVVRFSFILPNPNTPPIADFITWRVFGVDGEELLMFTLRLFDGERGNGDELLTC
jgi:hypothetical protein